MPMNYKKIVDVQIYFSFWYDFIIYLQGEGKKTFISA